jgi:hypothetical protein
VLIISPGRRPRSSKAEDAVSAADIVRIKPYFERPVELLAERRYYLAEHTLGDAQELSLELD